jgi:predicted RNA binding protein YcfA (HicA-like mRNA interferase family)
MIPPELRGLQARKLFSALTRDFFELDRVSGDHHIFLRALRDRPAEIVVVPAARPGNVIRRGTLVEILKSAGWESRLDLVRVGLLPGAGSGDTVSICEPLGSGLVMRHPRLRLWSHWR